MNEENHPTNEVTAALSRVEHGVDTMSCTTTPVLTDTMRDVNAAAAAAAAASEFEIVDSAEEILSKMKQSEEANIPKKGGLHTDDTIGDDTDRHDDDEDEDSVWEYVESSVHTILLKELWKMDATEEDIMTSLGRLWDSCVASTTTTITTSGIITSSVNDPNQPASQSSSSSSLCGIRNYQSIETGCDIFYKLGGYSILVGVMNKYSWNAPLQGLCSHLFAIIIGEGRREGIDDTDDNNDDNEERRSELIYHAFFAGTIDTILQSMHRFPHDQYVQSSGCQALHAFTNKEYNCSKHIVVVTNNSTHKNVTNNSTTTPTMGVVTILHAMKQFPNDPVVQYYGCHVLYNITYADLLEPIRKAGAISVLASTMERYHQDTTTPTNDHVKLHHDIHEMARHAMIELLE